MVEYPKVKHKLPALYEEIIQRDHLHNLLVQFNVIPLNDIRENKLKRQQLVRQIQSTKKGDGGKVG